MKEQLNIKKIQDISEFQGLREEWNELLEECEIKNVFLTWEWLYTWWKVYGLNNDKIEIYIIEVRDENGKLLGLEPMKIRKTAFLNYLEFIGNGSDITSEYLGPIVREGYESVVRECIKVQIREANEFNVINLKPLHALKIDYWNSPTLVYRKIKKFSTCPIVELPKTWNELLKNQSANFVKKSKECYRVCKRDFKLKFVRIYSEKDLSLYFNELERLHHLRWNGGSRSFRSDKYRLFHRDIARQFLDKGWLRLFFLIDAERPIAALYCYAYNGVYYYYQSGRDPAYEKYRVGFVLMNIAIQEAINEGAKVFDMLTGEEAYKYRWAKRNNVCYHFIGIKTKGAYLRNKLQNLVDKFTLIYQ
jgi:CelD/BcsL family acetyltransferase involved in cellulose biosynthesis